MKIGYDAKRYYHNKTGLGNYSRTLVAAITSQYPDTDAVLYDSKSLERTFRLGRKAKAEGCDLFHGLSNELPRDVVKAGIPSIVTMHDVAWRTFPDMYKWLDRHIYDWKYGWSARNATHVVCISESTKRDVMRFYGVPEERISVIYQPVQQVFYTPMNADSAKDVLRTALPYLINNNGETVRYVLTVGSINSRKNLLGMVKAFETIPVAKRPLFVVVGNGHEYRSKVEQYIADHNLTSFIHIESNIHDATVLQALYTETQVMMYPSFYEGFGLPVVEAALQKCAVITSNVSSLPEAAGPGAIQVDPNSVPQLAEALQLLLDDEGERAKRAKAGYDYCMAHFLPEDLTRQMEELYQFIVHSS